jgi:hypothetical protein
LRADGYVLQVDSAFGPRLPAPNWSFFSPVELLLNGTVRLTGGQLAGKLFMLLTLFLCGFGAMVLLRRLPWWAQCAGGLLAVLNPFVFDRLVEGQWGVVAATGCLFLWVAAWESLQRQPSAPKAFALAVATVAPVAFSSNFLGIVAVLALVAAIATRPWRDRATLRWTAAATATAAVLLLYGVIPFFAHAGGGTYTAVTQFGRADFTAFRATPDAQYGVLPALAGLYGEWAERTGRIPVATSGNPWWPVATAILVALALIGAWYNRRRAWLLVAGLIGLALSAVTATGWGLDAVVSLAQHLPLLNAYRDAQKWDALWLVALVVLGAEAVAAASTIRIRGRTHPWATPVAATLMALATFFPAGVHQIQTMPQLVRPVTYPSDWYAAADYLQANVPQDASIAVLPWHLYEPLDFAGRLVANPASVFFPGRLITPTDPELPGQQSPPPSPGNIGQLSLGDEPHPCALADALRGIGARWVIVEQVLGAQQVLERLRPCGFRLVEGDPAQLSVLHG